MRLEKRDHTAAYRRRPQSVYKLASSGIGSDRRRRLSAGHGHAGRRRAVPGPARLRHVPSRVDVPLEIILTRSGATPSVVPHLGVEDHVRWDLPDDLVLASGLGQAYSPRAFRIHYRGNVYNRSAALPARHTS